jgi:hypothetical protein
MKIKPLEMANFELVELKKDIDNRITPHCKLHGAMNKVSDTGLWRCISTWKEGQDNACRAGCVEIYV